MPDFVDQVRAFAIQDNVSAETLNLCRRNNVFIPKVDQSLILSADFFKKEAREWWSNWRYHLTNRIRGERNFEELIKLFPQVNQPGMQDYLTHDYDLSILPLYLSNGLKNAVSYVLPVLGYQSQVDPYAIKHQGAAITTAGEKGKFYVATRKKNYATYLLTLTVPWAEDPTKGSFLCPIGCRNCYRGCETRHRRNLKITNTGEELMASHVRQQAEALVKVWSPDVYDLLVSGGEPLLFANKIIKRDIIDVVKKCPYLKSFRICTGALALGLFARFDDELIKMLADLRQENGIQVALNVHLTHPENFTPEMVEVSRKLRHNGLRLMPQVPLIEGTNFFHNNLTKTVTTLRQIARLSTFLLNEPIYKFIVDMQGGVPLLQALKVYRALFDRHQFDSNIIKPTSFELFLAGSHGNVNLSYHTLFAMSMAVNERARLVTYEIPHPAGQKIIWQEPLIQGINNDPKLLTLARTEPPLN